MVNCGARIPMKKKKVGCLCHTWENVHCQQKVGTNFASALGCWVLVTFYFCLQKPKHIHT
jgi:hypothetical protein